MSLRGIRHGAIIDCAIDGCAAEFVTYSYKILARPQAIAAGWLRVPRWTIEPQLGKGRAKVDVCPAHAELAHALESKVREIESALGRPLTWQSLIPGDRSDPLIMKARERTAARLEATGKLAALEAYCELVGFVPSGAQSKVSSALDSVPANETSVCAERAPEGTRGGSNADRASAEQPQTNDRQGEADPERSPRGRRSARRDRTDHDQRGGDQRGGDPDDRARAPRLDALSGHAPADDAAPASVEPTHEIVEGVSLNPPPGDNLANGLPAVPVQVPARGARVRAERAPEGTRGMPRARRNKDGPTVLDVIAEIFRRSPIPRTMSVADIVAAATGDLELPTNSKTPHTIVSRDLALDVKHNGDASRFVRTAPGRFMLRIPRPPPVSSAEESQNAEPEIEQGSLDHV